MVLGKNWNYLCLVAILIIAPGLQVCLGDQRKQLPFDSTPYAVGDIDVTSIPGEFNKTLTNTVRKGQEIIYTFNYTEYINTTRAVRIHVSAPKAKEEFPALFVVRQQRFILSWQVPLMLENIYDYYNVSRTLCPVERNQKTQPTEEAQIFVDVSSASREDIHFVLKAEFVEYFELESDEWQHVSLTPPEPKYFLYKFPEGINSVVVKVESENQLCLLFSIQNTQCPVFDLVRNVEFTGEYQTVTQKGAITITRSEFPNGQFFVVFVVRPEDFQCLGIETLRPPHGQDPNIYLRRKTLKVKIEPSISESQYLGAVLGAVMWFMVFYVVALFISIIYALTDRLGDEYTEPIQAETTTVEAPSVQQRDWTEAAPPSERETDSLIIPANVSNPGTPGTETSMSYGAIGASNDVATPPGTLSGAEFGKRNGIPHRIAPPHSDDSDSDHQDYDMLHDAEREKDVFRTKTILFVADLARKPRKRLDKKYKLYHWNLITISIFYALPVVQLVITYQTVLHVTGNEDICYYNFYCSHPLGVLSSFNNVFSNIGYVMLGLLFLMLVFRKEMLYKRLMKQNDRLEKHCGIPQHFGLFYAMGIALMMEGVLSGCYHVCPSYSNFQFDTSYMYMIGWLCMLKIYQTRHPDINPHAHIAYFAIAFVIFLAVVGVVYGTLLFWILFAIVHMLLTLFISTQIYYMGRWRFDVGIIQRFALYLRSDVFRCSRPLYLDRMILLIIGNLVNVSLTLYGVIIRPKDFASLLLSIFIINLLMYFAFYIIMKLRSKERILPVPLLFSLIAMVTWGFAFYFFLAHLTSWQKTPALSREGNKDCLLFDFYDDHDIWHMLSSMGLFFCFMILLTLDDDLIHTPRDRIYVF